MSRFTIITHPTDPSLRADYGIDPFLSWWVEVSKSGKLIESYDGISSEGTDMAGILRIMVRHGFFSALDVAQAHRELSLVDDSSEIGDGEDPEADESVRRAAEVISKLKEAAGGE